MYVLYWIIVMQTPRARVQGEAMMWEATSRTYVEKYFLLYNYYVLYLFNFDKYFFLFTGHVIMSFDVFYFLQCKISIRHVRSCINKSQWHIERK